MHPSIKNVTYHPAPKPIEIGDHVTCKEAEWHCLCGDKGCAVYRGEKLTVTARRYFDGLGPMLQFEERPEHADDESTPWFLARAFVLRYDA